MSPAAAERKSAGARPLAIEVEAERGRTELHCCREARVQVDDGDVVDADAGEFEGRLAAEFDRRSAGERVAM